jgi:hypothetical protein
VSGGQKGKEKERINVNKDELRRKEKNCESEKMREGN